MTSEDDSIPISLVAHWVFCPRRAWLEAVGETPPQVAQIAEGTEAHQVADVPKERAADLRSVNVRHRQLGFHGRIDRLERLDSGALRVVEYKATPVKRSPSVTDANRIQLALQVMALESNGELVTGADVYFTSHHRRVPVEMSPEDREAAEQAVSATRTMLEEQIPPQPLVDDPKCMSCSHASICLPDEHQLQEVRRRIIPPDSASQPLHLTAAGSRARLAKGRLIVDAAGEQLASMPMERVASVTVHGNVDLSGALVRELLWRGIPIVWCTGSGRVVGWASGATPPNGGARFKQFAASADGRIDLAREMVSAKVGNQATILRRFGGNNEVVGELRHLSRAALDAPSLPQLFGTEGRAATHYFELFPTLLAESVEELIVESFPGRVGRGAGDPLNVSLNYCYGLLLGEVTRAILACGLDPHAGVLHSPQRNKPALALDLMEEFRAPVADATVLTAFNNGELRSRSFTSVLEGMRLTPEGRKKLIATHERRMATEFTHPLFKYRVSWRRAIEVQARLFLGVIDGTQQSYKGIRVR